MEILELMMIFLLIMKIWFKLDIDWIYIIAPSVIVAILEIVYEIIVKWKALSVGTLPIKEEHKEEEK